MAKYNFSGLPRDGGYHSFGIIKSGDEIILDIDPSNVLDGSEYGLRMMNDIRIRAEELNCNYKITILDEGKGYPQKLRFIPKCN